MKNSKYYKRIMKKNNLDSNRWLSKLLITVIIVLVCLIITNFNIELREEFKREVLEDNINFGDFNKIYNRFMIDGESTFVSNVIVDTDIEEIDGRYRVNYGIDSPVEVLKPGIIVFDGIKDDLGDTIIVQGNDGVDIWYSGVSLNDKGLYDYVSSGDILGNSEELYVTISIYEDGNLLKYEEYIK